MRYSFSDRHTEALTIFGDNELVLSAPCVVFENPVKIMHSTILELGIYAGYFLEGLELSYCSITSSVIWQSGGHNSKQILISNCIFHDFVDFEDCWFMEPIEFNSVAFLKGTNLFGNKETPMAVTFEKGCIINDVSGDLAIDTYKQTS